MGDLGSIPGSGRSPGEGNGNPLQYSCLGNPMDRRVWRATVHGVTKSQTWLATTTFIFFSFSYTHTHTHTYTHTDTHTHKYIYMYTYILFIFFSIMVYHRTLNTVPCLASFLIPSHKLSCWQFWGRHFYTSSSILPDWHLEKWVQEELSPNHLFHRISH